MKSYFQTTIALDIVLGITTKNLALHGDQADVRAQLKTIVWNRCEGHIVDQAIEDGMTVAQAVRSQEYDYYMHEIRGQALIAFAIDGGEIIATVWIEDKEEREKVPIG